MEFLTISHFDIPEVTDEMMEQARQKFMPLILATGADNVQLVCTGDSSVSVVTHFPDEERGKAAMDKIGAVRMRPSALINDGGAGVQPEIPHSLWLFFPEIKVLGRDQLKGPQ